MFLLQKLGLGIVAGELGFILDKELVYIPTTSHAVYFEYLDKEDGVVSVMQRVDYDVQFASFFNAHDTARGFVRAEYWDCVDVNPSQSFLEIICGTRNVAQWFQKNELYASLYPHLRTYLMDKDLQASVMLVE